MADEFFPLNEHSVEDASRAYIGIGEGNFLGHIQVAIWASNSDGPTANRELTETLHRLLNERYRDDPQFRGLLGKIAATARGLKASES
jgi:hypothetical protein